MPTFSRIARSLLPLALLVVAGVVVAQDVAQTSKTSVLRRLADEVYIGESFDLLDTEFMRNFNWLRAGDTTIALADWQVEVEALAAAMPDLRARPVEVLSDGDWAAGLFRLDGTFSEPLDWHNTTFAPNDDEIEWMQFDIVLFANGRAVTGYSERDTFGLEAQLGAGEPGTSAVAPLQAASVSQASAAQPAQPVSAAFTREDERRFGETLDAFLQTALVNPSADVLMPQFSDDVVIHLPEGDTAFDGLLTWLGALKTALPEGVLTTPAVLVDDEFAAARLVIAGVAFGGWVDASGVTLPPNGQTVTLTANLLARFNANAEIAEVWLVYDRGDWTAQFAATTATDEPS